MKVGWTHHLLGVVLCFIAGICLGDEPSSRFVLNNGLRVVVSPSASPTPVAHVHLGYDLSALSVSDFPEVSRSRLLRSLLEPTPWAGPGQGRLWVEDRGGSLGWSAPWDTIYLSTEIPTVQLATVLWREAERMRSLVVQGLPTAEEGDGDPWLQVERRARAHLYGEVARGRRANTTITVEELGEQVRRYFTPNNAALALTGGVSVRGTRSLVEKYFGDIPRGSPPPPQPSELSYSKGERRLGLEDRSLTEPLVWVEWPIPSLGEEEQRAFEVMATVLLQGDGSRLYQRLVATGQVSWLQAGWEQGRGIGRVWILMAPGQGDPIPSLTAELADVALHGPTENELVRARQLLTARIYEIQSDPAQLGRQLLFGALQDNDPAGQLRDPRRWVDVDSPSVAASVRAWFAPHSRSVVDVAPASGRGVP